MNTRAIFSTQAAGVTHLMRQGILSAGCVVDRIRRRLIAGRDRGHSVIVHDRTAVPDGDQVSERYNPAVIVQTTTADTIRISLSRQFDQRQIRLNVRQHHYPWLIRGAPRGRPKIAPAQDVADGGDDVPGSHGSTPMQMYDITSDAMSALPCSPLAFQRLFLLEPAAVSRRPVGRASAGADDDLGRGAIRAVRHDAGARRCQRLELRDGAAPQADGAVEHVDGRIHVPVDGQCAAAHVELGHWGLFPDTDTIRCIDEKPRVSIPCSC